MRSMIKALVRPAARPLLVRMYSRIDAVRDETRAQLAEMRSHMSALRGANENLTRAWLNHDAEARARQGREQALIERLATLEETSRAEPTNDRLTGLENRVSADGKRNDDTLRFLQERVEFVRREMMFELQHGARADASERPAIAPSVMAPERVKALKAEGLKLNVGCGHIPRDGYVNVDLRDLPNVDIVADAGNIGIPPGSVNEIFSSHLLEHFPEEALKRRILPHWAELLRTGGRLHAIVPDGEAMILQCASGAYGFPDFREVLFGSQDYQGDFHYNLFTPDSLKHTLEQAGFQRVEILERGRRNGQCFEFEIAATRSDAPLRSRG